MVGEFYAVIPAGGSGTRLWPLSRVNSPKFLHRLTGINRSLLQATMDRLVELAPAERTLVVTGAAHATEVGRQLPTIPAANIVIEPQPRDSAPAIGLAAALIAQRDPKAIMGSFAADHRVDNIAAFTTAVRTAVDSARQGYLVTVGLTPTAPETGYGYIHQGLQLSQGVYAVQRFKEKPSQALATEYVSSGEYLWNASMFVWRVDILLAELQQQLPELYTGLQIIAGSWGTKDQDETLARVWPTLPKISIDYAVMENAAAQGRVATVPASIGWTDVGDWHTLGELNALVDAEVTVIKVDEHAGEVIAIDSGGSVVVPAGGRLVSVVGLKDIIVVDTADALLVCARERAQDVKKVVERLAEGDPRR